MMRSIIISLKNPSLGLFDIKFDAIGAFASGLCMIHCIATPFFFIASACSASCCSSAPLWWKWLDYFFLFISFFAIIQASRSTTSELIKYGLYASWITLFLLILNINFQWIHLAENVKFIPAFMLVGFHMYNMRYCQCENKECC